MAAKTVKRESILPLPYLGGGATLYLVRDPAGLIVEPHHHLYHEFDYVMEGRGEYGVGRKAVHVAAGDFVYIAPGVYHRRSSSLESPLVLCNLIIDNAALKAGSSSEELWPWWRIWRASCLPPETEAAVSFLLASLKDRERRLSPSQTLRCAPGLRALLSAYGGALSGNPGLAALASRIRRRPEERLSLDEEAARLGVSRFWLSRLFSRVFGVTMLECRDFARIELAMEALKAGRKGVAELALELGYSGKPQFISVFKRLCGMVPSEFRKLHAKSEP